MSGILSYTGQVLVYHLQRSTKLPVKVAFNRRMSGEAVTLVSAHKPCLAEGNQFLTVEEEEQC